MKFPSIETATIYKLNGGDLIDWINETYNKDFDPIGDGDVPGDDSSGAMVITVNDWSMSHLKDEKIEYMDQYDLIKKVLYDRQGYGEYHLSFQWG